MPNRLYHKMLLIMRLTTVILIASLMQVTAATFAQRITIEQKNIPLKSVLKEIRKQSGFDFFYDGKIISDDQKIDISIHNVSIEEALRSTFSGLDLSYEIEGKKVAIKKKSMASFIEKIKLYLDDIKVSGLVTDENGRPLIGATIKVKDSKIITKTGQDGSFTLNGVDEKATLIISFIGYADKEVKAKSSLGFIKLKLSDNPLNEIQVIAYGAQSKRFSVASVNTVTAENIEKQPVTNPLLALQGQAPGLAVTSTSGIPGSQVLVQIRGQNTLNSTLNPKKPYDQPLFIVDGVPFATQNNNVSQFASLLAAQGGSANLSPSSVGISPFNNINPADIESISILKDADATSIYGSKGANGVILITTKKGKTGPTSFSLNVNTSVNSVGRPVQLLNTAQYLQLRRDAFASDGLTPSNNPNNFSSYAPDLTIYDQNKYTDWEKVIYGKNPTNTDIHATVSGGAVNNTFLISAGYNKSSYNYPGDFADQRFSLHSNLHHISSNSRLTIDLINDFGYEQNHSAGYGGAQDVIFSPNLPDLLSPSGSLNWSYKGVDLTTYQFYASLLQPTYLQNYNFNTSFHISYKLLKGLTIVANMGYNRNTTNENSQVPGISQNPANIVRTANFSTNNAQAINIEPQINYSKTIGKGELSALIGATYRKTPTTSTYTTGTGYSNDNFLGSINGVAVTAGDDISIDKYVAAFARLNYIYDHEFIINLTGRRDGSSRFGPANQFGNFGSAGAGWIFSEQDLIKKSLHVLSYGKISGSYGTSGSDGIMAYQYQSLFKPFPSVPAFQGIGPSYSSNLYNPNYSWATKKSLNISLDLGFFNNRLLFNSTYYRNRESNQLVNYPLPIQAGISSVLGNLDATVQNQGFEFSISSTNVRTKNFSWRTNFNLSFNRNKLLSYPNLESSSYSTQYAIGQPTSMVYGYLYKGVNPSTGLFEFYKKDGTVTSNPAFGLASAGGDQVAIADRQIKYMGGFGNTFTYKQFSLYVFCQFASQNAPNYMYQIYGSNQLGFSFNQPLAVLNNYWKAPGDVTQLQRLASSYSTPFIASAGASAVSTALKFSQSNGAYSDDTYLRVKTVSFSYELSKTLINKMHIKGASVFINGQNLLTFTNYKVGDPEQPGSFTAFPVQRVLAFGLNLKF
jgi:TonB-linked SusC/RagA family outer membrane protein